MDLWLRAVIVLVCLCGTMGLVVNYDTNATAHDRSPSPSEVEADYGAHVGQEVLFWGQVQSVSTDTARAEIDVVTANGTLELTVTGFRATVQPGGNVQVYGTLQPAQTIAADDVVVVNPAGSSRLYKYGVSLVGALLVLVQFFRHWRIDRDRLAFEGRTDG